MNDPEAKMPHYSVTQAKISCTHKFLPILYGCPPDIYKPEVEAGTAFAGGNPYPGAPKYRCKKCGTGVEEIE